MIAAEQRPRMRRALVVVAGSDRDDELIEEAAGYARGQDAELVVFGVVTEDEYENDQAVIESIEKQEGGSFEYENASQYALRTTESLADPVLAGGSIPYEVVTEVADEDDWVDVILDAARDHGCDHVFVRGKRRSPAGKAVFGDTAQQVILGFDGYVTIGTDE
jgi:nucleotide-binding universal stress UspA family protein